MKKLVIIFGIVFLSVVSCQNVNEIPEPPEELKSIPPPPEALEIELDDKRSTNETKIPSAVRSKCYSLYSLTEIVTILLLFKSVPIFYF